MISEIIFATVLAVTPLAADSPPTGPRALRLLSVEGVPSETAIRAEFMAGFNETLAAETFMIETRDGAGAWRQAGVRGNRFRLADDARPEDAWTLQVVVRAPPPFSARRRNRVSGKYERFVDPHLRASRGMTLAVTTISPEAARAGARVAPEHLAFAFPQGEAPAGVVSRAAEGFRFPWRDAGRVAATLALERLHRSGGDLGEDTRCDLTPAVRADATRSGPDPGRGVDDEDSR